MSEDNVEVVRRAISAYNRRDFDALRAVNAPDIELDWTESIGLDAGVYRGQDDVFTFFRQYFEAFPSIEIEPDRFIERGDAVVVATSAQLVGRDGIETSARSFMVFRVENGHVTRLSVHQTMPELDLEELVRWAYAYFNREHEPPPTWHPDGEFVNAREDPDHATYSGIERFAAAPGLVPLVSRPRPSSGSRSCRTVTATASSSGCTSRATAPTAERR